TRSPGAVYTLVRARHIGSTRPSTEMPSDTRCRPRSTDAQYEAPENPHHRQPPESPGQKRHAPGLTGKSPTEMLGTIRLTEGQRHLVLAENYFVVIEISPKRVAQLAELVISLGSQL